jgi:predicted permease
MSPKQWLYIIPLRLRSAFCRPQVESELDEELQYHLDMKIEENEAKGMTREEARRSALLALGGLDQKKEECRDMRGLSWFDDFRQDVSYAFRILVKSPAFTIVAVLILALGIGANTAIVSTIDALIFRPMPFGQIDRLVSLTQGSNFVNYRDLSETDHIFSGVAAYMGLPLELETGLPSGRAVSANYFQVLGMTMTLGRGFLPEEEGPTSSHPVAVISHRLWKSRYGSDPAVVGKTITLNREVLTIVGVAPKELRDAIVGGPYRDLWIPFPMFARLTHLEKEPMWREAMESRSMYPFLSVIGRLKPDLTLDQANARMAAFMSNLRKAYPDSVRDWNPTLVPEDRVRIPEGNTLFFSMVLVSAALCILLVTCLNVANLLLARGSARQREIATRLALGASRARIVRQLLTEGLILTVLALMLSLAVYTFTLRLLPAFEDSIGSQLSLEVAMDSRVLVFAALIALLTTMIFSMAPAIVASRAEIRGALKDEGFFGIGQRKGRWRRILVVSQIALTITLLVTAGLFIKTVSHFKSVDTGFDKNVLILSSNLPSYGPDRGRMMKFYIQSLDGIRELPGVRSASWGEELPFDRRGSIGMRIQREELGNGADKWSDVQCNAVSSGYFKTMGIPVLKGRDFTEQDSDDPAGKVIVNEAFARKFWPDANAIGKRIRVQDVNPHAEQKANLCEVIGIAKDAKYKAPWENKTPYVYLPFWQQFYFHMDLHVSIQGNPRPYIDPILKLCKTIDPGITMNNARLISTQAESLLSQERSVVFVLAVFGSLALILAAIGLYGVISYSVAQRAHEFGIRVALGATNGNIIRQVVTEGAVLAMIGLAIGLSCSIALSKFIGSRMHGLSPLDPFIYAAISVISLAVAIMASFLPARAARTDPILALRID